MSIVDNQRQLQPEYVPGSITDRESERKALKQALNSIHLPNILLHGPRGTEKTLLTRQLITQLEDDIQHHYIDWIHHYTEHKAIRKLHTSITGEDTPQGFHTSKLQRKIEKQLKHVSHLIVLDEADFLLQNNGNSLLYYLSRINKPANLGITIVSAHTASLQSQIDERTYSTLQPRRIGTEPYTSEQVYQILSERARQSLEPTSLHHEALTYLASATENTKLGFHWLRHTAQNTSQPISEETGTPPLHRTNPVTPHRPPPKHSIKPPETPTTTPSTPDRYTPHTENTAENESSNRCPTDESATTPRTRPPQTARVRCSGEGCPSKTDAR